VDPSSDFYDFEAKYLAAATTVSQPVEPPQSFFPRPADESGQSGAQSQSVFGGTPGVQVAVLCGRQSAQFRGTSSQLQAIPAWLVEKVAV
jgi:hypothetical protein